MLLGLRSAPVLVIVEGPSRRGIDDVLSVCRRVRADMEEFRLKRAESHTREDVIVENDVVGSEIKIHDGSLS